MMFIELFAPKGMLDPDRRRRMAERLGTIHEMGDGTEGDGEEMAPESAAVFASMFQVVVHEPEIWVVGERSLTTQDRPHFLVRVYVPGPWRKDMSETVIAYATRIVTEEYGAAGDLDHPAPVVQVHVIGVSEGSIGLRGEVATSERIVELLSQPYEAEAAQGKALRDSLCGVLVPLDGNTATLELDGELYAFCCAGCRDAFVEKRRKPAAR